MHIRLLAVGERQPDWVTTATDTYAARLPRAWRFSVATLPAAPRGKSGATPAKDIEGQSILAAVHADEQLIALDEHGRQRSSVELSKWLDTWQQDGRDVCLVIGGADGLSDACLSRANARWSLSQLTLPHGLARVLVVEQLYRASSLLAGHPYHRA